MWRCVPAEYRSSFSTDFERKKYYKENISWLLSLAFFPPLPLSPRHALPCPMLSTQWSRESIDPPLVSRSLPSTWDVTEGHSRYSLPACWGPVTLMHAPPKRSKIVIPSVACTFVFVDWFVAGGPATASESGWGSGWWKCCVRNHFLKCFRNSTSEPIGRRT